MCKKMRLKTLGVSLCAICLAGTQALAAIGDEPVRARMTARLAEYGAQSAVVERALMEDARDGRLTQLLRDILKDAELRARSATLSRYFETVAEHSLAEEPGAWLLDRTTDLQRSILETDKEAGLLKPALTGSSISTAALKPLVDLTGRRGWNKGTGEELMTIADELLVPGPALHPTDDEQKVRKAAEILHAYQSARAGSEAEPGTAP